VLTYAVPDDLMDGWGLAEVPTEADALRNIRFASILVRSATALDLYDTYPSGLPTDLDIAEAMRDATCAQAVLWILAGVNPAAGTVGRDVAIASQTADGGSVTYADPVTGEEVAASISCLCPGAIMLLKQAGLASTRPQTW
jgi:hypothetical protein